VKLSRNLPPDLRVLVDLFYPAPALLGEFHEVEARDVPEPFRRLLAHDEHMTVTVEAEYGEPVDVGVLTVHTTTTHYSRKIVLRRRSNRDVVLFGLVRLNVGFLGEDVRREIESQGTPLGRILISHNVMRHVKLLSLWRVEAGPDLRQQFGQPHLATCYGRTALIYCNDVPAVELLEIVTHPAGHATIPPT
jgi:chorismate-pyruvate lyase